MEKEVIIKHSLTEETLTKASMNIMLFGRAKFFLILIIGGLIFNTIFNIFLNENDLENDMIIALIAVPAILLFLFFKLKKVFKKSFQNNRRYFTNLVFTINQTEFKTEEENFTNSHKWENLTKIKSTKKWHLIYLNKVQATIIDRAQLDTLQESELKEIFNSIKNKIKVV